MKLPPLPPDDLPPVSTSLDHAWFSQLEYAVINYFYTGCDRKTQALLAQCEWSITASLELPTLTIICPDAEIYWGVVGSIKDISNYLSHITGASRIQVIPGDRKNIYFEVEVGA